MKLDTERQIAYYITCVDFLKNGTNEPIYQTETDVQISKTNMVTKQEIWGEGEIRSLGYNMLFVFLCLTSLGMIISRSIHVAASGIISFFIMAE